MTVNRLQRLSTEHGARQLLERLISAGRCKLEDLDTPPPGHLNPSSYRNLLRDPEHYASPHVEVTGVQLPERRPEDRLVETRRTSHVLDVDLEPAHWIACHDTPPSPVVARSPAALRCSLAGTCLCQGVPARKSRSAVSVSSFGATPARTTEPSAER